MKATRLVPYIGILIPYRSPYAGDPTRFGVAVNCFQRLSEQKISLRRDIAAKRVFLAAPRNRLVILHHKSLQIYFHNLSAVIVHGIRKIRRDLVFPQQFYQPK